MARKVNDVSDGELAVLEVLWSRGAAAIRQVTGQLFPGGSAAHYATVQKQLERLEAKGFVRRDRNLHVHLFSAAVGREELIGRRVRAVVDKLCGGSLTPLLSHLAEARELSEEQRKTLRGMVDRMGGDRGGKRRR